jgi:hypothetical protein
MSLGNKGTMFRFQATDGSDGMGDAAHSSCMRRKVCLVKV